jgi:hypothetical protein
METIGLAPCKKNAARLAAIRIGEQILENDRFFMSLFVDRPALIQ